MRYLILLLIILTGCTDEETCKCVTNYNGVEHHVTTYPGECDSYHRETILSNGIGSPRIIVETFCSSN